MMENKRVSRHNSSSTLIVICGGMGPAAGLDLHRLLNQNTKAKVDQDHFNIMHLSFPSQLTGRSEFLYNQETYENPGIQLAAIMNTYHPIFKKYGKIIVCVPCNTFHAPTIYDAFINEIESSSQEFVILNMIKETADFLKDHNIENAGVLTTNGTRYEKVFDAYISNLKYIDETLQDTLLSTIYKIKDYREDLDEVAKELRTYCDELIAKNVQSIILGCTELPVLLKEDQINGIPLINPTEILAQAVLKEAKKS